MQKIQKLSSILCLTLSGFILAIFLTLSPFLSTPVSAEPIRHPRRTVTEQESERESHTERNSTTETKQEKEETSCADQVGKMAWLICSSTGTFAQAIDSIYGFIEGFLVVKPIIGDSSSPIFIVWSYARNITNVVFIIFLLIIVYSQITGLGLSNYGIKRTLPRIIIAAILINLSFIICSLLVDISNILGSSLHSFLINIGENIIRKQTVDIGKGASFSELFKALAVGGTFAGVAIGLSGGLSAFLFSFILLAISGIISIAIGFATIALRQAVIAVLVMVSPLAFVAYLLPNTEKWYKKWYDTFFQMLIFFPAFSFLFGVSRLIGWVFITSATDALGLILGVGIQVLPIFLAASLMKMSGTALGQVSNFLNKYGDRAKMGARNAIEPQRELAKKRHLSKNLQKSFRPWNPSSWRAGLHQLSFNAAELQKQQDGDIANLSAISLNASKRGKRIIGYDKNGKPIYSQNPVSNKYMRQEMKSREIGLRAQASNIETDNTMNSLGDYIKENDIKDKELSSLTDRQAENYLEYRTQLSAKSINERADNSFYYEKVREAAENYRDNPNNTQYAQAYHKLVTRGAGVGGFDTADENKRSDAIASVVANAYDAYEVERSNTVRKYTSYFDTLNPTELKKQYAIMRKNLNTEGIVASHNVLGAHGDYDVIFEGMDNLMENGSIELGTDACRSIAQNIMAMKKDSPALGRLGKFLFVEAGAYANGSRKTKTVTMKQFVTGEIDETITGQNGEQITLSEQGYRTKFRLDDLLNGVSWAGMDRTATNSLDYAIDKYVTDPAARKNIYDAILPQWTTDMQGLATNSEPMINILKQITGLKYDKTHRQFIANQEDPRPGETLERTRQYLEGIKPHILANMKSDTFSAIHKKFEIELGSTEAANAEFLNICTRNGNIDHLRSGDKSAINLMPPKLRRILQL